MKILFFLTAVLITNLAIAQVPNDEIGYWPFNGNANDESGNENDGTVNGATLTSDRYENDNSAYRFDGDDIIYNSSSTLGNEYTLSMWINPENVTGRRAFFSQYTYDTPPTTNRTFMTVYNGKLEFFIANSVVGTITINVNTWYHVVFCSNGKAYVNTIEDISRSTGTPVAVFNVMGARHNVGGSITPPADYFIGKLDDIRVYDRVLTLEEITALYHENEPSDSGWQFNEGDLYFNGGNVGIGTTAPQNKLDVNGTVHAREVKIDLSGWSDFVFEPNYELRPLEEVSSYIEQNGHLPEIPSAKDVEENGISVGEMNAKLLQKVEEQFLYIIELNKKVEGLTEKNKELEKEIEGLKK